MRVHSHALTILDAVRDPMIFGSSPAFSAPDTWRPWLAFLAAVYGLPLDAEGEALFCKATGRTTYAPPPGGWREVVCIVGRQAGKTRIGGLLTAFESALAEPSNDGELYALLLAQDWRAAMRASFSYIRGFLDSSPILRNSIVRETTDTIDLENGMRVATYPCRPASVRGLRARIIVADELAFFRSSEGFAVDVEMLRAARPCLATTGGRLVVISSPYGQSGALWELRRRHFGRDDSPVLVWQSDAPTMNPTLPADYLERMREDDPEAYRSEVLGEFRSGLSSLFDPETIDACVAKDRRELPPVASIHYHAFADPSGGRSDAFTVSVGHRGEGESEIIVDLVRAWPAPFNPSGVTAECAALLKSYGVSTVRGDRYAGEWPREQFRVHNISYDLADKPKGDLYLDLLAAVNSRCVELPDEPVLLRELRMLERRRGSSGRDRVDHPPGAHDDRANAVAGLVAMLTHRRGATWRDLYAPKSGHGD
jgi:hypothetical protein